MALPLLFLLIYWFGWRQSPPAPDEAGAPRAKSGLERLEEIQREADEKDLRDTYRSILSEFLPY